MRVTFEARPPKGNLDSAWFSLSLSPSGDICLGRPELSGKTSGYPETDML